MEMRLLAINEKGRRIGEDHPRAKLTNAECQVIREMNSDGLGYLAISRIFEVSKGTIADICKYRKRSQIPSGYKHFVV